MFAFLAFEQVVKAIIREDYVNKRGMDFCLDLSCAGLFNLRLSARSKSELTRPSSGEIIELTGKRCQPIALQYVAFTPKGQQLNLETKSGGSTLVRCITRPFQM